VQQSAGKVGDLVAEIASASNEQAQGIEQVNRATTEMDGITQRGAANAEEAAASSEELSAQAAGLKEMVDSLTLVVEGSRATQGPEKPEEEVNLDEQSEEHVLQLEQ
jgi:methyl-accepting chemotaxis protein